MAKKCARGPGPDFAALPGPKCPGPSFGITFLFGSPETSQSQLKTQCHFVYPKRQGLNFKIKFHFGPKRPGLNFKIKL